jgi:hypothetical protein
LAADFLSVQHLAVVRDAGQPLGCQGAKKHGALPENPFEAGLRHAAGIKSEGGMQRYDEHLIDVRRRSTELVGSSKGTHSRRGSSQSGKRNPMASCYTSYVVMGLPRGGRPSVDAFSSRAAAMRRAREWAVEGLAVYLRQSTFNRYVENVREGLAELAVFVVDAVMRDQQPHYGRIWTSMEPREQPGATDARSGATRPDRGS